MKLRTHKKWDYSLTVVPKYVNVAVNDLFEAAGESLFEDDPLKAGDVIVLTVQVKRPIKKKKRRN